MKEGVEPTKLKMVQILYLINRLTVKALTREDEQSLIFMILNDTISIAPYDRATLWDLSEKKPKLLGLSGQAQIPKDSKLMHQWQEHLSNFEDLSKPHSVSIKNETGQEQSSVMWLPIGTEEQTYLGLWLEALHPEKIAAQQQDLVRILLDLLMPAYAKAWEKVTKRGALRIFKRNTGHIAKVALALLIASFLIRVPLRVVAPAEVVADEPFVITAPLDGIVEQVLVKPGQKVEEGDVLFEYDKQVPLQELQVAKKAVEVLQSELDRASTLGLDDPEYRTQYSILLRKLEKEKINLDLVAYQSNRLTVKSPTDGIAVLERPDLWRGKPVQIGEQVLQVNNPARTKVRVWIPESDNIPLDLAKPIKVVLNVHPTESEKAEILYVSSESSLSEHQVVSFVAEAEWIEQSERVKLGLKGTAFLYGERVSLFYFVVRKPWLYLRNLFGV